MVDEKIFQVICTGHVAVRIFLVERAAVTVCKRHPVNFWSERAEAVFVRFNLRGQSHTHQCSAMKTVVKGDDCRLLGMVAGNLHGVLNGFSPTVGKHGSLRRVARHLPAQFFCKGDGGFIGRDHETGMGEFFCLVFDRLDDLRVRMPYIHHCNAAGEIDKFVTLDVDEYRAFTLHYIVARGTGDSFGYKCASEFLEGSVCLGSGHVCLSG